MLVGSPVSPDIEITLAAASAAASAARCASALAWYSVPISMDSAAIAMMPTIANATSAMVTPRSRCGALRRGRRISGGSMGRFSILDL